MGEEENPTVPAEDHQKLQSDYDALVQENDSLKTEHETVKTDKDQLQEKFDTLETENKETIAKLAVFEQAEKDQLINDIQEKSKKESWTEDELKKLEIDQLKLVLKAVDNVEKSRFKGIQAGTSATAPGSKLTVGDLYHKPYAIPPVTPGGSS